MRGSLCIDLESMWTDFETAIDNLIAKMQGDAGLEKKVLTRWQARTWTVQPFSLVQQQPITNRGGSQFTGLVPVGSTMSVPWSATPSKPTGNT